MYHVDVNWLIKTRAGRLVSRLAGLCMAACFVYWRFLTPKIHTASTSEIISLLPKELIDSRQPDKQAESRLAALVTAVDKFDPKRFRPIIDGNESDEFRSKAAEGLWNDGRLAEIERILKSGPIQIVPPADGTPFEQAERAKEEALLNIAKIRQLIRPLLQSALVYRRTGRSAQAVQIMLSALTVSERFWELQGPLRFYLDAFGVETSAMKAVSEAAQDPRTSPKDCEVLLKAIPPAPALDDYLVTSLRNEFSWSVLPGLSDPYRDFKEAADSDDADIVSPFELGFKTSYDAAETATQIGKSFIIGMQNAARPYSQYQDGARQIQMKAAAKLPMPPDLSKLKGIGRKLEKYRFKVTTYNTDNYYGRVIIMDELSDLALVEMSDRWRAMREAVRVELASRIYRASHLGALAPSPQGYVSLLGPWPMDPFDGSPMKYSAPRQVVYSVGQNLVDDGGRVSGTPSSALDVGLSLAISEPSRPKAALPPIPVRPKPTRRAPPSTAD